MTFVKLETASGIEPVRELMDKSRATSAVSAPILLGMEPPSWFVPKYRYLEGCSEDGGWGAHDQERQRRRQSQRGLGHEQ